MLLPKLVTTLPTYTRAQFLADLTAGVIVGIVALPLTSPLRLPAALRPTAAFTRPSSPAFSSQRWEVRGAIDSTAMHALRDLVRRTKKDGTVVLLSDVQPQPRIALERSGLLNEIGHEHVCGNIDEALSRAERQLAQ